MEYKMKTPTLNDIRDDLLPQAGAFGHYLVTTVYSVIYVQ